MPAKSLNTEKQSRFQLGNFKVNRETNEWRENMHINELEAICSRQACHYHDLFQKIVTLTAEPLPGGQWL